MTAPTAPTRGRPERRPAWTWLLPALSVALALGIPFLVWYGADAILESTDGTISDPVTDPAAPGYEVIVNPSPSHMVLSLDPAGDLTMVSILSLGSNDIGGTVLHLSPETVLPNNPNFDRIVDVYREHGPDRTRRVVARLLNINVDEMTVLDAAAWTQLVEPAGAIPVDITEDLVRVDNGETTTIYAAGNVTVEPFATSEFLGWVNPGEHPGSRMERHLAFWDAWMASIIASDDPGIVPGEVDSGIGRFLRGLARGVLVMPEPVTEQVTLTSGVPAVEVSIDELRDLVTAMIPFPLPPAEGARPRTKLLDGVGGLDLPGEYSPPLVREGAQVVVLGNAFPEFGVERTVVIYHDPSWEEEAFAFSKALGGASVEFEPVRDVVFDITVIIGEDQR
ncbi:MAG: hypothetical protein ACR2PK_09740 [Acidimicrobiales bacterium]